MRFTAVMVLVGVVASKDLIRLNTYDPALLQYAADDQNLLVDAAAIAGEPCVYLDKTGAELEYQVDMFSRTLDPRHWTNA